MVKRYDLSAVNILVIIRWLILILMIGFVLLQHEPVAQMSFLRILFVLVGMSNVVLMALPASVASKNWVQPTSFLIDIGFVTLTTYLVLGWKTDLLLVYFVIIFMGATQRSLKSVFLVTFVAAALYLTRSLGDVSEIAWADAQTLLAVPAFFVVALFTSFLSLQSRRAHAVLGGERQRTEAFRRSALRASGKYQSEKERVEELVWLDRQKNGFIESVTHEYRTALSSVRGFCELLVNPTVAISTEQRNQSLMKIRRNVLRLERLVERVSTVLDLEKGDLTIYKDPVDFMKLADECKFLMSGVCSTHPFEVRIEENIGHIECDALRIKLVLGDLLNNAVKFSPGGGLITLDVSRRKKHLVFRITDSGLGIPEGDSERIFEKFQQLLSQDEHKVAGGGMGLYIAREIITLHGGTIDVASIPGKGATFTCILPVT